MWGDWRKKLKSLAWQRLPGLFLPALLGPSTGMGLGEHILAYLGSCRCVWGKAAFGVMQMALGTCAGLGPWRLHRKEGQGLVWCCPRTNLGQGVLPQRRGQEGVQTLRKYKEGSPSTESVSYWWAECMQVIFFHINVVLFLCPSNTLQYSYNGFMCWQFWMVVFWFIAQLLKLTVLKSKLCHNKKITLNNRSEDVQHD